MFDLSPVEAPDLTGKTIVVTGAGKGIGARLCQLLSTKGARVFAGVHKEIDGEAAPLLQACETIPLDVTRDEDLRHLASRIETEAGSLDALVNNAGTILPIGRIDTLNTNQLRNAYEVNALGLHRATCAFLPLLRNAKGTVVNAGTGAASAPIEAWTSYCTSKAAGRMMTLMFAEELQDDDVQFFFLGIPPTDTGMQLEIRSSGLNPISKIAQADLVHPDVPASVMAWLCGSDARRLDEVLLDVRDDFFRAMMA